MSAQSGFIEKFSWLYHINNPFFLIMKQVPNLAFKIAQLPAGATTVDILGELNPEIKSEKDVERYHAKIVKKVKKSKKFI